MSKKLSPVDCQIISALQYDSDRSLSKVATSSGHSQSTVRRTVEKALKSGVLMRRTYINTHKLGLSVYALLVKLDSRSTQSRKRFRCALENSPNVAQLLELGGQFDFFVLLCVRYVDDVAACLERMSNAAGSGLAEKLVHVRTGWYHFGTRYLFPQGPFPDPVPFFVGPEIVRIDQTDHRILVAYSRSPDGSRQDIARKLGMPLTTLQYRVEQLQTKGVLVSSVFQLVAESIGYQSFRMFVSTRRPDQKFRSDILLWAAQVRFIVSVMCGFGPWDYEFRLETPSTAVARDVSDHFLDRFENLVGDVNLVPVARTLKIATYPFEHDVRDINVKAETR